MNLLGPPQYRNNSSKSTRYVESEIFLAFTSSAYPVAVKLDKSLIGIVRVELVEYKVTGVPVTAGVPNTEYLRIENSRLGLNSTTNVNGGDSICLMIDGSRTYRGYSPPRRISDQASGLYLNKLEFRIMRPDGQPAIQGIDYTGIYLTLRVTEDSDAPKLT